MTTYLDIQEPHDATRRVVEALASHWGLRPDEIMGRQRFKSAALARQIVMFVLREHQHPRPSFPEIAREFSRDHTTVMSACAHVVKVATEDNLVREAIEVARLALDCSNVSNEIAHLERLQRHDRLLTELKKVRAELAAEASGALVAGAAE